MKKIFNLKEEDNSILCLDFNETGEQFATAGKDCNIRIYD
jgi:WD40 repeat protein